MAKLLNSNPIKKIKGYFHTLFNADKTTSQDSFACLYPGNRGLFSSAVFNRLFIKIKFDKKKFSSLSKLNEKGVVVYTGKYKTLFDFLYIHTNMKKAALPYPEIGFDYRFIFLQPVKSLIKMGLSQLSYCLRNFKFKNPYTSGYISHELAKGRAGHLFLIEMDGFYKWFVKSKPDPLGHLITFQKQSSKPVYLVPQTIVFSSTPVRTTTTFMEILLGSNDNPGKLRRFTALVKNPEKISLEISDPVDLQQFLDRPDIRYLEPGFQAHRLRQYLVHLLNGLKRSVIGPVLKSREELATDILTQESLQTFMKEHAKDKNEPLMHTYKRAASYINEIAASYNLNIIYGFEKLLTWVFRSIFEGVSVDRDGLDQIKQLSKRAPVVPVPCHKSHLDYLLLSYVMFKNNMPCPHIAAGANLSFWPLGPLFRGAGAFFLRRTFKGAVLYSRIFSAYIEKLLSEGFNIEFFIEGGRSRTGKLLPPKLGFLSMLLSAHRNRACEDLIFIPVFVGYDRVLEEDAYLVEIEGGKKKPENISQLLGARKFLKKKYGKVYIKFDEPISLNSYLYQKEMDTYAMDRAGQRALSRSIGYKLINAINSIAIVTPHGIVACAVLNCPTGRFSKTDLVIRMETYMNLMTFMKAELSDTLTMDPDLALNHVIETFVHRKFIELADESEQEITDTTRFFVKDNKRPILDYYKNNAIAFFVPAAYTALAILKTDTFQFSSQELTKTYRFLQNLFVDEFSFDEERPCEEQISICLKAFTEDGIIVPNPAMPDYYNLTSEGFRKLNYFSAVLYPFLESYKAALLYFETYPKDKHTPKERIKKIQSYGIKLYKHQEILLKESLSKINYINACSYFTANGIKGRNDLEDILKLKTTIDGFLSLVTP